MRLKCMMLFPGQVVEARLVSAASQMSRTESDIRIEIAGPPPIQLPPPGALGAEIVEATRDEWTRMKSAGYDLKQAK